MNHQLIFLIRVSYKVINYNIVSKIIKNKIQLVEKKTRDQEHIKLKLVEKNFPLLNPRIWKNNTFIIRITSACTSAKPLRPSGLDTNFISTLDEPRKLVYGVI